MSDHRRQRLVSRRLEERAAGPDGFRAPVRAPDVRGVRPPRQRVFPPVAGGRGHAERVDQRGPHQLLGGRAARGARTGAVDGVRPDGVPPAGTDPRETGHATRSRPERAAPELREPPVRARLDDVDGRPVCAGAPVPLAGHRLARRRARGDPRRRAGVLRDVLPSRQRVAGDCRRRGRRRAPSGRRARTSRRSRRDPEPPPLAAVAATSDDGPARLLLEDRVEAPRLYLGWPGAAAVRTSRRRARSGRGGARGRQVVPAVPGPAPGSAARHRT